MTAAVPVAAAPPRRAARARFAGLGAVLERDFLVFTSRPRFLLVRTLAVVLPAGVIVTVISVSANSRSMGSSGVGTGIFTVSVAMVPWLIMLLAPILAASSISSERALNTLQIVLASPVSPLSFVLAKFLSRFGVVLVLVLATLPLSGICFLFGGVSGRLFLDVLAYLVGAALFGTAAGIGASAWSRSVATSALRSYLFALVIPLAHFVIAMTLLERSGRMNGLPQYEYLLQFNPLLAWGGLMGSVVGGVAFTHAGLTFLAWTCLTAAVAIALAAWRVGREAAHESAVTEGPRRTRKMLYENPVLDRSLRGTLLNRPRFRSWLPVGFIVLVDLLIVWVAGRSDLREVAPHLTFLCVSTFVAALAAMTTAAHSISGERETGALDMLLATRLTTPEVVQGKYGGVLLGVAPVLAVPFVHGLIAVALTKFDFAAFLAWVVSTAAVTLFFTAVGLWCSATAPTAGRAVLRAFAILIGGSVVHAVASGILMMVMGFLHTTDLYVYILGASPGFVGIAGAGAASTDRWNDPEIHVLIAWALWSAVYVFVAFWLVARTTSALEKRNEAQ